MKLLIKNGRIIDPASGVDVVGALCVAEGRIVAVGPIPPEFKAERILDATDKWVLPGLVDLSAQLSAPGFSSQEHLETEMRAALAGGVTTVVHAPEAQAVVDTPACVRAFNACFDWVRPINIYPLGAMTLGLAGQGLTEMAAMVEAGCIAFSQADRPVLDTRMMLRAMQYAKTVDVALWLRPQEPWLSQGGVAASGAYASRLGLPALAVEAETIALQTLLTLQRMTGVRLHLCRLSSATALAMVRAAKKEGLPITCDVAVNHLHLTDVDIGFYDSNFRLDPPLRGQRDRDAIRQGLLDGTIDAVCSSHLPITLELKQRAFEEATPGAIGLELLLSLVLKWAQDTRTPLVEALKLVTAGPSQVLSKCVSAPLPGVLCVGAQADICVVDPEAYWMVNRENLVSRGINTPFFGRELSGRVQVTVLRGEVAWELRL